MNLTTLQQLWLDTPQSHAHTHEMFVELVNNDSVLNAHRNYIDNHIFGMGERSFQYLWKLICDELPNSPKMLEIGVHKGQIISLWKLLRSDADVYGITPLDGRGTGWTEDDYASHIGNIHDDFSLEQPNLIIGSSQDDNILKQAWKIAPFDVIYVDGDHSFDGAFFDLLNYGILVKTGGLLVIDDCNGEMKMPWGYFQGIDTVTEAKLKWLETDGDNWEFICSVVHVSVYRRK